MDTAVVHHLFIGYEHFFDRWVHRKRWSLIYFDHEWVKKESGDLRHLSIDMVLRN